MGGGELHGDAGQHMHGGQPGGAQICQGDFHSHTAPCGSLLRQAGDSQAEERFKLNAKTGSEERRGAQDSSKVEDGDENML